MLFKTDPIFFISDLHISPYNPIWADLLLPFLTTIAPQAKQLYILGDLFDWWIGQDIEPAFQQAVQAAFLRLQQHGTQLFFVAGNRDFLLSNDYLQKAGCTLLPDPTCIDLHGVPTLITHGDILCTQDVAYQRYRCLAHSRFIRWLVPRLPRGLRLKLAQRLRAKSQIHQRQVPAALLDVTPEAVPQLMSKYQVSQMIHGHVHRFAQHDHLLPNGQTGQRFVLGDWGKTGTLIMSTANGLQRAIYDREQGIVIV